MKEIKPQIGDWYEYVGNAYEVIDVDKNTVWLQSVNDDTHHEIRYDQFISHPETYTHIERQHNPVIIPEAPRKIKYRVTFRYRNKPEPVSFITEAASREDLNEAMTLFTDNGATVLSIEELP